MILRTSAAVPERSSHSIWERLAWPLLDRIDLHIEVLAVAYKEMRGRDDGVTIAVMRERVLAARDLQRKRGFYNSDIPSAKIRTLAALDDAGERTLEMAVRRLGFSARAHDRILKVARTIADLDKVESVTPSSGSGGAASKYGPELLDLKTCTTLECAVHEVSARRPARVV